MGELLRCLSSSWAVDKRGAVLLWHVHQVGLHRGVRVRFSHGYPKKSQIEETDLEFPPLHTGRRWTLTPHWRSPSSSPLCCPTTKKSEVSLWMDGWRTGTPTWRPPRCKPLWAATWRGLGWSQDAFWSSSWVSGDATSRNNTHSLRDELFFCLGVKEKRKCRESSSPTRSRSISWCPAEGKLSSIGHQYFIGMSQAE